MSITTQISAFLGDWREGFWPLPEQAAWWPRVQLPGARLQVVRLVVPKQHLGETAGPAVSQGTEHWVGLDTAGHPAGAPGFTQAGTDGRLGQGFGPLLAEQPGLQETQDLLGSPSWGGREK